MQHFSPPPLRIAGHEQDLDHPAEGSRRQQDGFTRFVLLEVGEAEVQKLLRGLLDLACTLRAGCQQCGQPFDGFSFRSEVDQIIQGLSVESVVSIARTVGKDHVERSETTGFATLYEGHRHSVEGGNRVVEEEMHFDQVLNRRLHKQFVLLLRVGFYVPPEIFKNDLALAVEPSLDKGFELFDTIEVEFAIEDLVEQTNDAALLEEPDLPWVEQKAQLVEIPRQAFAVNMKHRGCEIGLAVEHFNLETIA